MPRAKPPAQLFSLVKVLRPCPARTIDVSLDGDGQSRSTNRGGTPNRRFPSQIAANNSPGTATWTLDARQVVLLYHGVFLYSLTRRQTQRNDMNQLLLVALGGAVGAVLLNLAYGWKQSITNS